jgi:hypothetical protein
MLFGSYIPFTMELFSKCLNSAMPNMKKKKDEIFEDLKKQVVKPLKDLATNYKTYL